MTYQLLAKFPCGKVQRTETDDLAIAHVTRTVWQTQGGAVISRTVHEHDQNEVRA